MFEWAVTSSVLILVVLALRRLLMGKISLRLQYGLWALVLVRLLVPASFGTTALSILNLVETANISNPVIGYMGGHTIQLSISEPDPTLPLEEQQEQYEKNLEQWQAGKSYSDVDVDTQTTSILDVEIPVITIPVKPGRNLASIVEVAAMNNRNRKMGHNAALELTHRMDRHFQTIEEGGK